MNDCASGALAALMPSASHFTTLPVRSAEHAEEDELGESRHVHRSCCTPVCRPCTPGASRHDARRRGEASSTGACTARCSSIGSSRGIPDQPAHVQTPFSPTSRGRRPLTEPCPVVQLDASGVGASGRFVPDQVTVADRLARRTCSAIASRSQRRVDERGRGLW